MLSLIYFTILLFSVSLVNTKKIDPNEVTIVILSQNEPYHIAHAKQLQDNIYDQAMSMDEDPPNIILSHETNITGAWTIVPLLPYLTHKYPKTKWFLFCYDNTAIRFPKLIKVLSEYNAEQDMWIGYALYDHEPTIIHHFAEHNKKFKYPHIAAGFAVTAKLLKSLSNKVSYEYFQNIDFTIDVSYEFSTFVSKYTKGVKLTHVPEICIISSSNCATYPRFFHPCDTTMNLNNIYFAIKTCSKYHTERIPIIKQTWGKYVENIGYFSDVADINLREAFVVPNTTQGHCAKTREILVQAAKIINSKKINWLIISDDDTIFSVTRVARLLTCYNPTKPIAIGERYGFRAWDGVNGYDYLTGGAGVVLSAPLVRKIIESELCKCPSADTPDDMFLFGQCLSRIEITPTHCPMFHQARPLDYATAFMAAQEPVSFHKFWMINPRIVYKEWFAEADSTLYTGSRHTEL